jgi:hypothetical protein
VVGIPTTELISIKQGGNHSGTYVHRKVRYNLAQWILPDFAVQVSNVLDNLNNKIILIQPHIQKINNHIFIIKI